MQFNNIKSENIDIEALKQKLFTLAYVIFLAEIVMSYSMYGYIDSLHPVFSIVRKVSFVIIFAKLVLDLYTREFTFKEMVFIAAVGCILVISAIVTKERVFLGYWGFIVAGRNVDYRKIIKLSLIVHMVCFTVVLLSTYAGIIENLIFYRNERAMTGRREGLGFHYTSEFAHMFFYTTLMWIYYRKDKIRPLEYGFLIAATLFVFIKTDTKNPMTLGMIAIAGSMLLKYSKFMRTYRRWYTPAAVCMVPALIAFILWASYNYSPNNIFLFKLNELVMTRLDLGHRALDYYTISLFGEHIDWPITINGFTFYIDSSYLMILFNQGIVVLAMLAAASMALGRRIGQKKDIWMLLCFALIAVHSTFDAFILNLGYNSFIMLYSYFKET